MFYYIWILNNVCFRLFLVLKISIYYLNLINMEFINFLFLLILKNITVNYHENY